MADLLGSPTRCECKVSWYAQRACGEGNCSRIHSVPDETEGRRESSMSINGECGCAGAIDFRIRRNHRQAGHRRGEQRCGGGGFLREWLEVDTYEKKRGG